MVSFGSLKTFVIAALKTLLNPASRDTWRQFIVLPKYRSHIPISFHVSCFFVVGHLTY